MIEYTVKVHANGDKFWCLNGQLHREDGPAIEYANGDKYWYLNSQRHREDGPAVECANGTKYWYLNGQLLAFDRPAIEYADGDYWYLKGQLHREEFDARVNPVKKVAELTVAEISKLLGYEVKVVA